MKAGLFPLLCVLVTLLKTSNAQCPTRLESGLPRSRCVRACSLDSHCRRKQCLCDGLCGKSCIHANAACDQLTQIPNSNDIDIRPFNKFNATATYSCLVGYKITGSEVRICQGNKKWSGHEPTCSSAAGCGAPPTVSHATVKIANGVPGSNNHAVGTMATYKCRRGYIRRGYLRIRCMSSKEWRSPQFTCQARNCGDPGNVQNGHRDSHVFTFPNRVKFRCNMGYELVGRTGRTADTVGRACQANGKWSRSTPTCRPVSCPPLYSPDDGLIVGSDFTFRSRVTYSCSDAYRIKGSRERICQANKRWSGQTTTCKLITCRKPFIALGSIDGDRFIYGAAILFRCNFRTTLFGPRSASCGKQGWSKQPPACLAWCKLPEDPHASISSTKPKGLYTDHNSFVTITCTDNYKLLDSNGDKYQNNLKCTNGTWTTSVPTCQPEPCSSGPTDILNGNSAGIGKRHGDTAKYNCNDGYELKGQDKVECRFGDWQGYIPYCEPKNCTVVTGIANGGAQVNIGSRSMDIRSYSGHYSQGFTVRYTCNGGYTLIGDDSRRCDSENWVPPMPPRCNANPCKYKPNTKTDLQVVNPQNGPLHVYEHDTTIRIVCRKSYILNNGIQEATCIAETWTPQKPFCEERRCSVPMVQNTKFTPAPRQNSRILDSNIQIASGRSIYIVCDGGHKLETSSFEVRCKNGMWDPNPVPKCLPKACNLPQVLGVTYLGRSSTRSDVAHNTNVQYKCQQGQIERTSNTTCKRGSLVPYPTCIQNVPGYIVKQGDCYGHDIGLCDTKTTFDICKQRCDANQHCLSFLYGHVDTSSNPNGINVKDWCCLKRIQCSEDELKYRTLPFYTYYKKEQICTTPNVANGYPMPDRPGERPGVKVTIKCNYGYELRGSQHLTCQDDLNWDVATPSCEKCIFKFEMSLNYGLNGHNDRTLKGVSKEDCRKECAIDHKCKSADYSPKRKCQMSHDTRETALSAWSKDDGWVYLEKKDCQLDCKEPPTAKYTQLRPSRSVYKPNAHIDYTCTSGHLVGDPRSVCQSNGTWSQSPPKCIIFCENGKDTFGTPSFDVDVRQRNSVLLSGSYSLQQCERKCKTYQRFMCKSYVHRQGSCHLAPHFVTATSNPKAGNRASNRMCIRRCSRLDVQNGRVFIANNNHSVGSEGFIKCDTTYELSDGRISMAVKCEKDAEWNVTSNNARCFPAVLPGTITTVAPDVSIPQITCPRPPDANSDTILLFNSFNVKTTPEYFLNKFPHGSKIVVTCNIVGNQKISGSQSRQMACQNGYWTGGAPLCKSIRSYSAGPPRVSATMYIDRRQGYGATGRTLRNKEVLVFSNEKVILDCWARRGDNPIWLKGRRVIGGPSAHFLKTGDHYRLQITSAISSDSGDYKCRTDGGEQMVQIKVIQNKPTHCNDPGTPLHGKRTIVRQRLRIGSRITYSCNIGYKLFGYRSSDCDGNAEWKSPKPICKEITCDDWFQTSLDLNLNAPIKTGNTYGSRVRFSCKQGYMIVERFSEIVCQSNGQWDNNPPTCTETRCTPYPTSPFNGRRRNLGNRPGNMVVYSCNEGYSLTGSSQVVCQANGTWSHKPNCVIRGCDDPGTPVNGRKDPINSTRIIQSTQRYVLGSRITFVCDVGTLSGSKRINCIAENMWSAIIPTCS